MRDDDTTYRIGMALAATDLQALGADCDRRVIQAALRTQRGRRSGAGRFATSMAVLRLRSVQAVLPWSALVQRFFQAHASCVVRLAQPGCEAGAATRHRIEASVRESAAAAH